MTYYERMDVMLTYGIFNILNKYKRTLLSKQITSSSLFFLSLIILRN